MDEQIRQEEREQLVMAGIFDEESFNNRLFTEQSIHSDNYALNNSDLEIINPYI
jgi:hypothetical protein